MSIDEQFQWNCYTKHLSHGIVWSFFQSTIDIVAAYGSHKDIGVYNSINIRPDRIFVVGKVPKKAHSQAQVGMILSV